MNAQLRCLVLAGLVPMFGLAQGRDESWLTWPPERALAVGRAAHVQGDGPESPAGKWAFRE
jgi:hypothetical protein